MSGVEVVGGISAVITIIDTCIRLYNNAQKDLKLSETFQAVARRLPILSETLKTCVSHLEPRNHSLPKDVCEALEEILDHCEAKAHTLEKIYRKVITTQADGWEKRYIKYLRHLGTGNRVEELMKSITEDIQIVVNHKAVQWDEQEHSRKLDQIIQDLQSLEPSSAEDNAPSNSFTTHGGTQNNLIGDGQQFNYEDMSGTQNFHYVVQQQEDFSFTKPVGLCLDGAPELSSDLFVGRQADLQQMSDKLQPGALPVRYRRLVLGGIGGIGKTQLAIAYAKKHQEDYTSIFWLNATSEITMKASIRSVTGRVFTLQNPDNYDSEQMLTHFKRWLAANTNTGWLLIFDNYDEPRSYDIKRFSPSSKHGSVVITSRQPDQIEGDSLPIRSLQSMDDSLAILETRSRRQSIRNNKHACRLAERMAGLPLALATAGSYLRDTLLSFEEYLQEYDKRWNLNPRGSTEVQGYEDRTLYTTWDISYTRLEKDGLDGKDATKILKLLAYFGNQSISYDLLHAGVSDDLPQWLLNATVDSVNFSNLMSLLVKCCFVETQLETRTYGMHVCVHDWTLAKLNDTIDPESYRYAFNCVARVISNEDLSLIHRPQYTNLASHAKRLTNNRFLQANAVAVVTRNELQDTDKIARLLWQQDELSAAIVMYEEILIGCEQAQGPEDLSTLRLVGNLSTLYRTQGKLNKASHMYQRALDGFKQKLGANHISTLGTIDGLGALYYDQGKLDKAEEMYRLVLVEIDKTGAEHRLALDTANNLGLLYTDEHRLGEAEQMFLRALNGSEKLLGSNHVSTLDTVSNLGNLYRAQGNLDKAEQMYQRALTGYEQQLRPEHTHILDALDNLGNLYRAQGKLHEAEQMYLRALAGKEKALGDQHSSTLITANNLGSLYSAQGKPDQAEELYLQVLDGYEKAVGPEHYLVFDTLNNLALLYAEQGKMEKAEQNFLRVLDGREKIFKASHPSILSTLGGLGLLYVQCKKPDKAEQMYKRLLGEQEKTLGSEHSSTMDTVHALGSVYRSQGKIDEAEQMFLRALSGKEKTLGPEHESTLSTMNSLAGLYRMQGKIDDAERMFLQALAGKENTLGMHNESTWITIRNLRALYKALSMEAEIEQLATRIESSIMKSTQRP